MMYWLYIAISLSTGEPGSWHHYPIDGWDNEKNCQEARKNLSSIFAYQYEEPPGKLWLFYCKAESKT